jgi:hypothetical protein
MPDNGTWCLSGFTKTRGRLLIGSGTFMYNSGSLKLADIPNGKQMNIMEGFSEHSN